MNFYFNYFASNGESKVFVICHLSSFVFSDTFTGPISVQDTWMVTSLLIANSQ